MRPMNHDCKQYSSGRFSSRMRFWHSLQLLHRTLGHCKESFLSRQRRIAENKSSGKRQGCTRQGDAAIILVVINLLGQSLLLGLFSQRV